MQIPTQTPVLNEEQATFVWVGARPPRLIGDFNHWQSERAVRLKRQAQEVWAVTLSFAPDAYIEYTFVRAGQRLGDPLNPRRVSNGFEGENPYFYMPQGHSTPWIERPRGTPRGTLTHETLEGEDWVLGGSRKVTFYQPKTDQPAPLLIVFDGGDYLRRAALALQADTLIAAGKMRPLALALVESHRAGRTLEYACNDATAAFVLQRVLPAAQARLRLLDPAQQPGAYGVMGASMGGAMALYLALRAPRLFGRVLAQSGGFERDSVLLDLLRFPPPRSLQIWMDAGQYDFLLEDNRFLRDQLLARGYPLVYREYPGGHNFTAWRDDLAHGLVHLFPPEP